MAFEIMPFENSLVVIALRGSNKRIDSLFWETTHPLAGLTFRIDKTKKKPYLVQEEKNCKIRLYITLERMTT
jgi:hypothetical protein